MAIVKMKKMTMIALQSEKEALIRGMQRFGGLQVINLEDQVGEEGFESLEQDQDNETVGKLENRLSQVKYTLDFIRRYDKTKKPLFAPKLQVKEAQYPKYLNDEQRANTVYESCKAIDGKFTEFKSVETKLHNLIAQLNPWISLDICLADVRQSKSTNAIMGFISTKYIEDFKNAVEAENLEIHILEASSSKESTYMLMIYHLDREERVSQITKQYGWTKVAFNDLSGTPKANTEKVRAELAEIENKKAELVKQAEALVEHRSYLEILFDILTIERDKSTVVKNFGKTDKTFMVTGWVPEKLTDDLTKVINGVTEKHVIYFEAPKEDEDFPVLLDNPAVVKPLEMITEQYSLPSPKGLDPNLVMTPFFVMFFGMMVSDAGYGIIIALITAFALFKFKPGGGMKKMLGLLCLGGISTFLWGVLFGGWFGGLIALPAVWFDPLKNPLFMLMFCLALGVVQLYTGMALQAYKSIRSGNILDAVFDQGFWYLLLTGLMFMAVPAVAVIGKYMAIAGTVGLILTQGRSEKNIFKKLISGVLSLYNVTAFLGDVLSYSRLFALGLATGVIGTVINAMASMLGGSFIGYILMVVFMVLGHTFNIAINVLGAYVHSSRLQYVEFFGKFFEGDGKPFEPFRVNTKYIE